MATVNYNYLAQFAPGVYRPNLDPNGSLPANVVSGEVHTITPVNASDYHFIVPLFAPMFKSGFQAVHTPSGGSPRILVEGIDYQFAFEFIGASRGTASPVYGGIVFLNNGLAGQISLTYRTLGGNWVVSLQKLTEILANRVYNPRVISWEQVVNYPTLFPPSPHEWNLTDLVGMREVVAAINALSGVVAGRPVSVVPADYSGHVNNMNNPHNTTKAQVGLGAVNNYATATDAETVAGVAKNLYVTPSGVKASVDAATAALNISLDQHIQDTNNPHQVSKDQIGLSNVGNFPMATQVEAVAHVAADRYMNPARTWDAILAALAAGLDVSFGNLTVSAKTKLNGPLYVKAGTLPSPGVAAGSGITFSESTSDSVSDTGIFSDTDGRMIMFANGTEYLSFDGKDYQRMEANAPYWGSHHPVAMNGDFSNGAMGSVVFRSRNQGDGAMAGCSFMNEFYAIKMGLRSDGYFGIGGASSSNWRWYSSPNGDMIASGNVAAYSDPRLKENVEAIEGASDKLAQLRGCHFTWKHGIAHVAVKAGRKDLGVMADEVKAVFPEIVYKSISLEGVAYDVVAYEKLVPVLIMAHNEHREKIKAMEQDIRDRDDQIKTLETQMKQVLRRLEQLENQSDPL